MRCSVCCFMLAYVCSAWCSGVSVVWTRLNRNARRRVWSVCGAPRHFPVRKFAHVRLETQTSLRPLSVSTNGALETATIAAGDPFVKQANLILGVIVLLSAAPNDDTAPPTPRGQALTPTHPRLTVVPHL